MCRGHTRRPTVKYAGATAGCPRDNVGSEVKKQEAERLSTSAQLQMQY